MHFTLDPAAEAFRAEVREFVDKNLPEDVRRRGPRGYHDSREDVTRWMRILHRQGWSMPGWPREYGGPGWSPLQQLIFEEECYRLGAPQITVNAHSLVGPVIYTFGSSEQKQRHLPPMLDGSLWWGQGFSEPNAGSDLASLKTSAVLDGDHYVVNGQKIWTSMGHLADWLFVLVRTDPKAKPQRGISFLLMDRHTPGITIRPIIMIDQGHSVNEVFFENVRVPAENLVGEPGAGWTYAKFLLENERAFSAEVPRNKRMFERLRRLAAKPVPHGRPLIEDPVFANRMAQAEVQLMALEFLTLRALSEHDHPPEIAWPAGSILHVRGSELQQAIGELTIEAMGLHGMVYYPEYHDLALPPDYPPGPPEVHGAISDYLYRRAVTIYGGSNEIQRNIMARGLLGAL